MIREVHAVFDRRRRNAALTQRLSRLACHRAPAAFVDASNFTRAGVLQGAVRLAARRGRGRGATGGGDGCFPLRAWASRSCLRSRAFALRGGGPGQLTRQPPRRPRLWPSRARWPRRPPARPLARTSRAAAAVEADVFVAGLAHPGVPTRSTGRHPGGHRGGFGLLDQLGCARWIDSGCWRAWRFASVPAAAVQPDRRLGFAAAACGSVSAERTRRERRDVAAHPHRILLAAAAAVLALAGCSQSQTGRGEGEETGDRRSLPWRRSTRNGVEVKQAKCGRSRRSARRR